MVPIELIPVVTPIVAALATQTIHNVLVCIDMGTAAHLTATNFGEV